MFSVIQALNIRKLVAAVVSSTANAGPVRVADTELWGIGLRALEAHSGVRVTFEHAPAFEDALSSYVSHCRHSRSEMGSSRVLPFVSVLVAGWLSIHGREHGVPGYLDWKSESEAAHLDGYSAEAVSNVMRMIGPRLMDVALTRLLMSSEAEERALKNATLTLIPGRVSLGDTEGKISDDISWAMERLATKWDKPSYRSLFPSLGMVGHWYRLPLQSSDIRGFKSTTWTLGVVVGGELRTFHVPGELMWLFSVAYGSLPGTGPSDKAGPIVDLMARHAREILPSLFTEDDAISHSEGKALAASSGSIGSHVVIGPGYVLVRPWLVKLAMASEIAYREAYFGTDHVLGSRSFQAGSILPVSLIAVMGSTHPQLAGRGERRALSLLDPVSRCISSTFPRYRAIDSLAMGSDQTIAREAVHPEKRDLLFDRMVLKDIDETALLLSSLLIHGQSEDMGAA